jgi:hypothetical protein
MQSIAQITDLSTQAVMELIRNASNEESSTDAFVEIGANEIDEFWIPPQEQIRTIGNLELEINHFVGVVFY